MKKSEFIKLTKFPKSKLLKAGFRKWDEPKKGQKTLMLIPKELFKSIPQGFPVVDIFGKPEKFDIKTSDDDVRFGCLPYGILK